MPSTGHQDRHQGEKIPHSEHSVAARFNSSTCLSGRWVGITLQVLLRSTVRAVWEKGTCGWTQSLMETVQHMNKDAVASRSWPFHLSNSVTGLFKCHTKWVPAASQPQREDKNCKVRPGHLFAVCSRASQRQDKAGQSLWKSPPLWDYLRLMAYRKQLWRTHSLTPLWLSGFTPAKLRWWWEAAAASKCPKEFTHRIILAIFPRPNWVSKNRGNDA